LAARKKARGLKLEALIKENPCNGMKQNKTKLWETLTERPEWIDFSPNPTPKENPLQKNPKPLTTLEKLQTHKKPTMETSKSNNRNSHKNTKGNCIPRQTPGKLEKDARKKDQKIFHKRETGEMNPKLFSLATRVLPEPHSLIHTPPKTPSFIKDKGK
jgi:hypothetical protein